MVRVGNTQKPHFYFRNDGAIERLTLIPEGAAVQAVTLFWIELITSLSQIKKD